MTFVLQSNFDISPSFLSVAAEGAAIKDQRGSGLYPESVCSLSSSHMERQ